MQMETNATVEAMLAARPSPEVEQIQMSACFLLSFFYTV